MARTLLPASIAASIAVIFAAGAHAKQPEETLIDGKGGQMAYLEIVPAEPLTLTFQASRACKNKTTPIEIVHSESTRTLPSAETGKPTKVRIVHVSAAANEQCAPWMRGAGNSTFTLDPHPNMMTHVYLDADQGVQVKK